MFLLLCNEKGTQGIRCEIDKKENGHLNKESQENTGLGKNCLSQETTNLR